VLLVRRRRLDRDRAVPQSAQQVAEPTVGLVEVERAFVAQSLRAQATDTQARQRVGDQPAFAKFDQGHGSSGGNQLRFGGQGKKALTCCW